MTALFAFCALLCSTWGLGGTAQAQQSQTVGATLVDLAAVRELYASASFEEALSRLSAAENLADVDLAEQYRALCLLALGRTDEAEKALERILVRKPFYTIAVSEVSPRLVAMFREVRRRVLPDAARSFYSKGKASFEQKDFADASTALKQLLAILDDEEMAGQESSFADLKLLGEGFLKLAEAELAAAAKAAPPGNGGPGDSSGPRLYSGDDLDVRPPTVIRQDLPTWVAPRQVIPGTEYRGVLEVVVDGSGTVESAAMRQPLTGPAGSDALSQELRRYEAELVSAAKGWQFRPATLNGQPVKYRRLVGILLRN